MGITVKFPGNTDKLLYLNSFTSFLGTGGTQQRMDLMDDIDDEYAEEPMLVFSVSGNLDAPELLPSGQTIKSKSFPSYNVHTRPGSTKR